MTSPDLDATFARVAAAAAGLPGIAHGASYRTPLLKVGGKFVARIKDADTLVVRCPLDEKEFLLEADPSICFETDHYKGYPAILVGLAASARSSFAAASSGPGASRRPGLLAARDGEGRTSGPPPPFSLVGQAATRAARQVRGLGPRAAAFMHSRR
jgi:hypothetical protein